MKTASTSNLSLMRIYNVSVIASLGTSSHSAQPTPKKEVRCDWRKHEGRGGLVGGREGGEKHSITWGERE